MKLRTRWLLAVLGCLWVECNCGRGPKHLPETEFNAGKATLDALERLATARTRQEATAWRKAADEYLSGVRDVSLVRALTNYSISISERNMVRLDQDQAARRIEAAKTPANLETEYEVLHRARTNEAEWEVTIKACRDDVAQWFVADAPATHTCEAALAPVRNRLEHELRK